MVSGELKYLVIKVGVRRHLSSKIEKKRKYDDNALRGWITSYMQQEYPTLIDENSGLISILVEDFKKWEEHGRL